MFSLTVTIEFRDQCSHQVAVAITGIDCKMNAKTFLCTYTENAILFSNLQHILRYYFMTFLRVHLFIVETMQNHRKYTPFPSYIITICLFVVWRVHQISKQNGTALTVLATSKLLSIVNCSPSFGSQIMDKHRH